MGKLYGHKAPAVEYCSGFVDENRHWNNGFLCPLLEEDGQIKYCCGTDKHKYCCVQSVQEQETEQPGFYAEPGVDTFSIPLVTGVLVAVAVLTTVAVLLVCYFCKYCPLHKRRKRNQAYSIYDGDGTSYCNEFVMLPGRKFFPAVIESDFKESDRTTDQLPVQEGIASTSTDTNCPPQNHPPNPTSQINTLACPPIKDFYRDSGYYPSALDADSMTCLTENLALKRAREHRHAANDVSSSRHSWPVDNGEVGEARHLPPKRNSEERDTGNRMGVEEDEEESELLEIKQTVV